MVHGVRQLLIAMKSIDQKDPAAVMESARHPDCKPNADGKIAKVTGCDDHGKPPRTTFLNMFN
jgi:hypothetical protein